MRSTTLSAASVSLLLTLAACSSSNAGAPSAPSTTPDSSVAQLEDAGTPLAQTPDAQVSQPPTTCISAREQLMGPITKVSKGAVTTLSDVDGVRTLYVDASAGGTQAQQDNPRVYLNLETGTRVDVDDMQALRSTAWDLALKRPILHTNSGDAGPGQGDAAYLEKKSFDAITPAMAEALTFSAEKFFDADCNPMLDQTNAMRTSFTGWYSYDTSTSRVTPASGAWVVRGATGKLYKVAVLSYYATPEGGESQTGGRYKLKVKALQ